VKVAEPSYLELVEAHFVALRGRGYALSGRDVGRVLAWQSEGVPLRVVLQTLDEEAKKRGPGLRQDGRPLSLGRFASSVRERARELADRAASAPRATPQEGVSEARRFLALRQAIARTLALEGIAPQALARASELEATGADAWEAAVTLDALVAEALAARLDADARRELDAHVDALIDRRESREAQAERARFERASALRARFGVRELARGGRDEARGGHGG